MKYLVLVVTMLFVVGCSSTPSKLERIEANEAAIAELQNRPEQEVDLSDVYQKLDEQDEKIDRMFEKSQYK